MHMLRAAAAAAVICTGVAACGSASQNGAGQNGAGQNGAGQNGAGQNGAGQNGGMIAAADRSVQFTADGTTTYGTLHIPAHRGGQRLAAALLLAGSGPTDRNGDDAAAGLEPHTLQLIAGVLGPSTWPRSSARPTRPTASCAPSRPRIPAGCWSPGTARAGCTRCWSRSPSRPGRPGSR